MALALGGCVVGPNYRTPAAPTVTRYTAGETTLITASAASPGGAAQTLSMGADVPGQWWTLYHCPALDALVARALAANPDLASAQAALRAARESYYSQRASAWPTASASYQASRQETASSLASILSSNADLFTLHTAQVSVGYVPDVFGAVRRQTEGALAQAQAQRFQTEAVYLTLTSNVVVAAITQAGLQDQADATAELIAADRETLERMRTQLKAGEISTADVAAQEAVVAQAEQTLPGLRKQIAQQRDLLADLTGRYPSQAEVQDLRLAQFTLPLDLPLSLPSRLVEQRPDIRAADANLAAASAQLGVAIAARLPSFALSADAGGEATRFSQLFSSGNGFWTLTGGVTQPIFDAGDLLHKQRAAEAALDQAKAQYRGAVLSAFQNVADTLEALNADAATLRSAAEASRAAETSLDLARAQLAAGETGELAVLSARQALAQDRIALVQAQAARFADTAALYQALGGGWWNRAETQAVR
jgi:NodT family efflux transporter outer membrane factor (OMF) lipoprotein